MKKRPTQLELTRERLWADRELYLPHILEHHGCGVWHALEQLCLAVGWVPDSYVVAALFDVRELLTEVGE